MTHDNYNGPERRKSYRPKILSDEEIEMYLKGDRKDIDRLILYSLNRLVDVQEQQMQKLDCHQTKEEMWTTAIDQLGGIGGVRDRAKVVNAIIEKANMEAELAQEAKKVFVGTGIKWALRAVIFAAIVLFVYYWNGHMPASAHITLPKP